LKELEAQIYINIVIDTGGEGVYAPRKDTE